MKGMNVMKEEISKKSKKYEIIEYIMLLIIFLCLSKIIYSLY